MHISMKNYASCSFSAGEHENLCFVNRLNIITEVVACQFIRTAGRPGSVFRAGQKDINVNKLNGYD